MQIILSYHPNGDLQQTLNLLDRHGLCWANGKSMRDQTNKTPVWINIYLDYTRGVLRRKCKYATREDNNDLTSKIVYNPEGIATVLKKVHEIINSSYDCDVVEKKLFEFNRQIPSLLS